jgi:hypothetical protein
MKSEDGRTALNDDPERKRSDKGPHMLMKIVSLSKI